MAKQTVAHIEVSIGQLPEWYLADEGNCDVYLEDAVERYWQRTPFDESVQVSVIYNYQTDNAIVKMYDADGNLVSERDDHDYTYALNAAKQHCGE